ncbi:hypothetical protein GCM10025778_01610 [Paeniglutamicibacter antarcticus]|uniref:Uncharacterized protein n=1 Tax=Paeniglutamicibacter antarcticus TaxID=494023 RepID=A0ABP9THH7_9MICC
MDAPEPNTPKVGKQLVTDTPVSSHPKISPPKQAQPEPGLDSKLEPKADLGGDLNVGTGRLMGRKASVTGGDSGIGAAVAHLPSEEEDARKIIFVDRVRWPYGDRTGRGHAEFRIS